MAVEMFLRMDGVAGGSRNYNHKGWADLITWSWDLDRAGEADHPSTDEPHMNEICLVKAVDIDSTALMSLFAERKTIKTAEINIVPVVGKRDVQQKYIAITLEDVRINSIKTGGSVEESVFKEKISLQFGKIKYEYHDYGDIGPNGTAGRTLTSYAFSWDVTAAAGRVSP